ncbi:MAG TPA: Ig-like domain-containing protein [Kofleriaceae bacterium]|nr:Ig-like domain-containing protein [Kofleriaceae bacterium]
MKRLLVCAVLPLLALATPAVGDTKTWRPGEGDTIEEDTAPQVLKPRPRLERVWIDVDPAQVLPAVNSNKIYLNNCKPNGCVIRPGNVSSLDGSGYQGLWNISSTRTLTPFSASDTTWNNVVACVKDVFTPFGVEITTTNPSPAPHFEIMIAGSPTDLGMSPSTGGVSPFSCQQYIPNSLVFDFQKVWGSDVEEICATAAQEIAHSFALDHVTDASDPLTYFSYSGRKRFKDAQVQCGSDCVGGKSPQNQTCTGTNGQNHPCACTGQNTQNSVATIKALFGTGTPTPPTVKITSPKLGDVVAPGFPVRVDATDDNGIGRVELYVNNTLIQTLIAQPYAFNAPAMLTEGTHKVKVLAFDIFGTSAEANVQVVIGQPCGKPSDCPTNTDTCLGGRCVPGPGVQGGLGTTCNSGPDCASGQCAQDSAGNKYCVEPCVLGEGQCPDNFGCLDAGGQGVCWPGYDDGSDGGICSAGGDGGAVSLGLAFASLLFVRRRRK